MRKLSFLVVASLCLLPAGATAAEPAYDLVIRNGKIVDGTGNPWFRGDVAIRGDRIVAVGRVPPATAKREIDAKGLVVAPGFIDMHSHSDYVAPRRRRRPEQDPPGRHHRGPRRRPLGRPVQGQADAAHARRSTARR